MTRYALKKDFPGSKIGDVWVKSELGFMSPVGQGLKMHRSLFEPFNDWFEDCGGANLTEIIEWIDKGLEDEKLPILANDFVEKLKAWTRLKDKGFHFLWWLSEPDGNHIDFYVNTDEWDSECSKDLDLLFGGEDE